MDNKMITSAIILAICGIALIITGILFIVL